jgi:CTP:molybdopterin cytidylyltransferase MocA
LQVPYAAIVLAAGRSARMGFPKALLDYRGAPFLVRILEACVALEVKHRVVVLGADASRIRPVLARHDCVVVENPDVDRGPISSLRLGLQALHAVTPRAALAWPVDFPHVRIATVERLLAVHARINSPAVVPLFGGRRGHPVLWDETAFAALEQDLEAGRTGARAVLHALGDAVVTVPVDDPAVTDELNTPEDYERLIRQINRNAF